MAYSEGERCPHILFIWVSSKYCFYGGAPLLHIFKPDHVLQEYAKKNLKAFRNSLTISVEELPLSHQESIDQLLSLHWLPTTLLQGLQKGFFSPPPLLELSVSDRCAASLPASSILMKEAGNSVVIKSQAEFGNKIHPAFFDYPANNPEKCPTFLWAVNCK